MQHLTPVIRRSGARTQQPPRPAPGRTARVRRLLASAWRFLNRAPRFLLVPLLLPLALTACGGGSSTGGGAATGPVTIAFWHSETASAQENLQKLVDRFNASQDGVRVESIYQGTDVDVTLKLIAGLSSANVPALVYMSEPYTQTLIDSGQVVPVQDYIDREHYDLSDFVPAAVAYYSYQGRLYAMPQGIMVPLLLYNKIPLREAGLNADYPARDLDELREVSRALQRKDSSGTVTRYGIAQDLHPWYLELELAGAGELYVNNDNGRAGIATETAFNNDAGRALWRWWHDMADEGLLFNVGRNSGVDNLMAIGSGRAVMTFGGSGALRSIVDILEKGMQGIEAGVAPIPGIPGAVPEGSPGVYSRSVWIMRPRPKAEQDAAWTFTKWLLEPEQQAEWFAGSGYLPVRNSAYDLPPAQEIVAKYPLFQVPIDLFKKTATTNAALGPLLGPFMDVREAIWNAWESMLSGNTPPDEALAAAAENGDAAIREYNRRMGR